MEIFFKIFREYKDRNEFGIKMNHKLNMEGLYRWAFLTVVVWYIGASTIHYMSHRSLWNDELAVLDSIRLMKPAELFFEPLRTSQAFPHFYLFCIQSFAKPFGNSIWSLRFFPFVCMMLAFGVWLRVARNELKTPSEYLTFALCWIASAPLIYYSAELKQYSMDVLISGLFVLFLFSQDRLSRQPRLYGFLLAISCQFDIRLRPIEAVTKGFNDYFISFES